jgi:tripartite-type tricarboxylate transporter receptor subunit TctC
VVDRLNAGTHKVLALADTREALALQGIEPAPTTPAEFTALLRSEIERWRKAAALTQRAN